MLEVDDVVESVTDVINKKKVKVKRLVHFQPRSSQSSRLIEFLNSYLNNNF